MASAAPSIEKSPSPSNISSAIESLRLEVRQNPESADLQCDLGLALLREEKYDEAVACYKEALRIDPEHPEAHIGLGHVLIGLGSMLKLVRRLFGSNLDSSEETALSDSSSAPDLVSQTSRTETLSLSPSDSDLEYELPPILSLMPKQPQTQEESPLPEMVMTADAVTLNPDQTMTRTGLTSGEVQDG